MSGPAPQDLPAWMPADIPGFGPGISLPFRGDPLWIVSPDVELTPAPEAAVCLLAPVCVAEDRPLRFTDRVPGARFLANARSATEVMGQWWGHDPIRYLFPHGDPPPVLPPPAAGTRRSAGTALFFSGGVDSFYSLVLNPDVDLLVFMAGFDVRLHKRDTWEAMIRSHRELADELGIRLVTVMTNVRAHPVLGNMRWPRYHGVILAALAHALRREASRWIVSATYGTGNLQPLGTHPDLDWRWGDEQVEIVHFGVDKWRAGKLAAMADVPMVHRRLRVCYGDPRAAGNCGRCEKCVRTRVIYHLYLPGIRWPGAADEPPLAAAIDAVRELGPPSMIEEYRGLLQACAGSDPVAMALRRLIERSERTLAQASPAVTFSDHGWKPQQRSNP